MHIFGILVLAAAARANDGVDNVPAAACTSTDAERSCAMLAAEDPVDQVELMQKGMRVQSRTVDGDAVPMDMAAEGTAELREEAALVDELVKQDQILERVQVAPALPEKSDLSKTLKLAQSNPPPEVVAMGDKLLFSMPRHAKIYQMNLDGSDVQTFAESGMTCPGFGKTASGEMATAMMGRPEFIAVDVDNNRMFWGDWLGGTGSGHGDPVANGNETFPPPSYNASVLSSPLDNPEIDPVATSAYYRPPPGKPKGIPGCNANDDWACPPARLHVPTGDLPVTHLDSPYAMAVDPVEKMVYWSDRKQTTGGTPSIQRASYDGHSTPPQDFKVDGMIGDFMALAIDHREGKRHIYWVEYLNAHPPHYGSQIRRANLDGTNLQILTGYLPRHPLGLALDLENDEFYWTEYVGGRIRRCPLNGCKGALRELVLEAFPGKGVYSSTSPRLGALALDPANNMMYWTEKHFDEAPPGEDDKIYGGMVKRAKLDGSNVEQIYRFTGANSLHKAAPLGIAIVIASPRTITTTTTRGTCTDTEGWKDNWNYGCETYGRLNWCTASGEAGPNWHSQWDKANLRAAVKACCACGGGQ